MRVVEFSFCFPLLSGEGWIPNTWCPREGKTRVDTAVTGMEGQGVTAPQQRDSTHPSWETQPMEGGMFSGHFTLLFLILWRRMWPGKLWFIPCVKGCAPGPPCESQDKMLSAEGYNRCCTVQLCSIGRWKVESTRNPRVCSLPWSWFVFAFQWLPQPARPFIYHTVPASTLTPDLLEAWLCFLWRVSRPTK